MQSEDEHPRDAAAGPSFGLPFRFGDVRPPLRPWPWYVAGPIIGLFVPLLLVLGNRLFEVSANLRHACAAVFPRDLEHLRYDWRSNGTWNLVFALGILVFHMYGIFATALPVATLSVQWLKRSGIRARTGEPIELAPKDWGTGNRYIAGGTIFGLGWALTGACPGPLFALLGSGVVTIVVALLSAMLGTWTYAYLRPRLPH
jgi:uncharacterized membrane protein YedE/YeeE